MLTWTSQGCATVWVNNYDVNLFPSGYVSTALQGSASTGDLSTNATFTVVGSATADPTYENANGTDAQATATITVTPATGSGCNVVASGYPLYVASGQSSTLTWSATGCATVWVVNQNGTVVSTASSGSISTGPITGDTPFMVHGELTADPQYTVDANTFTTTTTFGLVTATSSPSPTPAPGGHTPGTNIVSNGTVYFLDGTSIRPYTSAGAFLSYGFNAWSGVQTASSADLALPVGAPVPPMDGSLINDHGTVWVISKGQKLGFTNAAAFAGLGYSFKNVIVGDASFLPTGGYIANNAQAHPIDSLVSVNGTDFLMTSKGRIGIPSQAVFLSWGYSAADVLPANSYDTASNLTVLSPALDVRPATQLSAAGYYISTIYPSTLPLPLTQPAAPATPTTPTNPTTPTSAPITATALPAAELANCGASTVCFNANAQTCTLTDGTFSANGGDSLVNAAYSVYLQVQGSHSAGTCRVFADLNNLQLALTANSQQLLSQSSDPKSLPKVQAYFKELNIAAQSLTSVPDACDYSLADAQLEIQALQSGDIDTASTIESKDCPNAADPVTMPNIAIVMQNDSESLAGALTLATTTFTTTQFTGTVSDTTGDSQPITLTVGQSTTAFGYTIKLDSLTNDPVLGIYAGIEGTKN